jgi:hypothetical protein
LSSAVRGRVGGRAGSREFVSAFRAAFLREHAMTDDFDLRWLTRLLRLAD